MTAPQTYDEWRQLAIEDDRQSGAEAWKLENNTRDFDHRVIERRHKELVELRESGDISALHYYLNEGIHGNMGGMGAPKLYTTAKFGTKKLITSYTDELVLALKRMAAAGPEDIAPTEKLALFRRASLCYGHSALMLSGAGSLGPFHLGVTRTLWQQDLLPRVISGASAGSMIAATIGTRSNSELETFFSDDEMSSFFQHAVSGPYSESPTRQLDQYDVYGLIEYLIPDMTFIEAYEQSGRHINISVAPREVQQRSRLLNAITSPNATIREAVLASCAIPGIFPAVTLQAKDMQGRKKPYVPSRQWVDGSITDDLPAKRLARMYGANHFISSQTNPLVLWALQDPNENTDIFSQIGRIYSSAFREWMRAVYPLTMEAVGDHYPFNVLTRTWFGILTQEYTADINIIPSQRYYQPKMLLDRLSPEETSALITEGEKATWPKLERIRVCTAVNKCLDEILLDLDGTIR